MAYCLPKAFASKFMNALRDGTIVPAKLMDMSSAERRTFFSGVIGDEHAEEVNALFESKMLLKDQKAGLVTWAKNVAGITEPARRDLLSRIEKMGRILEPADEKSFLADLAAQKLGVSVTADEAKRIFQASQKVKTLESAITTAGAGDYRAGWTMQRGIQYGRAKQDLTDLIESMKPGGQTLVNKILNVEAIPKSLLTSIFHLSAPFVQGWGMMSTQRAWEGFGQMFKYFANEENYKDLNAYILSHPDYRLAVDGKLGITKLGDKLSLREEALQSTLVEQANEWLSQKTGVPNLVRASSRSFTGYLNYVRFNRFADLLTAARAAGEDVTKGSTAVREIAAAVNDFTGRGALGAGDKYASASPVLNMLFFSPRKISATINMFNPERYLNPNISPTARKAAIRQLSGSLIATGSVLGIAAAMGAKVDMDPRSANFAKIQMGDEKLDMTGGNAIYLRLLARIATNQEITSSGKQIDLGEGYKPTTRAELVAGFFRNKLSPVAGAMVDALYGTDPVGRPFSLTDEAKDKLLPITMNAFYDLYMNDPDWTAHTLPALTAIFGVGLESPLPPLTKTGLTVWGQPDGAATSERRDPTMQHLKEIGYSPSFPPNTINGVKLTDPQYHEYVLLSGRQARQLIDQDMQDGNWMQLPNALKVKSIEGAVRAARKQAATVIQMDDPSIIERSANAKLQKLGGVAP